MNPEMSVLIGGIICFFFIFVLAPLIRILSLRGLKNEYKQAIEDQKNIFNSSNNTDNKTNNSVFKKAISNKANSQGNIIEKRQAVKNYEKNNKIMFIMMGFVLVVGTIIWVLMFCFGDKENSTIGWVGLFFAIITVVTIAFGLIFVVCVYLYKQLKHNKFWKTHDKMPEAFRKGVFIALTIILIFVSVFVSSVEIRIIILAFAGVLFLFAIFGGKLIDMLSKDEKPDTNIDLETYKRNIGINDTSVLNVGEVFDLSIVPGTPELQYKYNINTGESFMEYFSLLYADDVAYIKSVYKVHAYKRINKPIIIAKENDKFALGRAHIETENIEFNSKFNVYTDDAQEAFYMLTPQVIEKILDISRNKDGMKIEIINDDFYICFDNLIIEDDLAPSVDKQKSDCARIKKVADEVAKLEKLFFLTQ